MDRKQEIYDKIVGRHHRELSPMNYQNNIAAMDQYAKEVAIDFAVWCTKNSIGYFDEEDKWLFIDETGRYNYTNDQMLEKFFLSKK